MSATAPRIASNTPDQRQLLVALGALVVAGGLLVAVAISRPTTITTPAAPAAPAPVVHDHGWSQDVPVTFKAHDNGWAETDAAAPGLVIRGTNGGGIQYTGIPYPAKTSAAAANKVVVTYTENGLQVRYLPADAEQGGRGTRFAR